jgi:dsDNA-specific endonuclease/ATPase MutS2
MISAILERAGTRLRSSTNGGATDPEEGSALAIAWLEEYLVARARHRLDTCRASRTLPHREDAVLAAMEFDEQTGRPNYKLHFDSGRSRALGGCRAADPETVPKRARDSGRGLEAAGGAEAEAERPDGT